MLTDAQRAARAGKLTASRIAPLMTGDAAAVLQLYLEMIGEAEPENLSSVWPVRLGEVTEPLQVAWWLEHGMLITRCGEVAIHPDYAWAAATLDGWVEEE